MSPFQTATRRKFVPYPTKSKGLESPLKFELSKAGILGALYLVIRGSLTGTLSALNPLGKASIIRQVRGFLNITLNNQPTNAGAADWCTVNNERGKLVNLEVPVMSHVNEQMDIALALRSKMKVMSYNHLAHTDCID